MTARSVRAHRLLDTGPWLGAGLFALALLVPYPGEAIAQAALERTEVDAVFADFGMNTPGCALGVVSDGRLIYGRGYGLANLEHDIPITTHSVFRSGSVSKQFTGAVVAFAAMEGHLSLEDELRTWVPELPDYGSRLTLLHALNHTSGLRDYLTLMDLRGLRNDDFYTELDLIERQAAQEELNFEAGSEHLYSNSGYFLLTEAVARAVGKPFREYADEVLFEPLGMTNSHFHDDNNHVVPLRADGYAPLPDGSYRTSMTTLEMIGDGGVYTSIEDMAKWLVAQEQDGLRAGLNDIVQARGVLKSGDDIPYALGITHGNYRGLPTIGHGGSFVGFRAHTLRFPTEGVGLVVLCNRSDGDPGRRIRRVADVVLAGRLGPMPEQSAEERRAREGLPAVTPENPAEYVGVYYSLELDVEYHFSEEDGALQVRAGSAIEEQVYRMDGDTLAAGSPSPGDRFSPSLVFRFERDGRSVSGFELDAGRVVRLRFRKVRGG